MRTTAAEAITRTLVAARAEFAEHGLAGARVDRISNAARVSKERLYAYFGSKEKLWSTVTTDVIHELDVVGAVDSLDGAAIVGRLFDHFVDHPDQLRLFSWHVVEGEPMSANNPRAELHHRKVALVTEAQRDGRIGPTLPAETIVSLMIVAAATCASQWLADPRTGGHRETIRSAASEVGGRILAAPGGAKVTPRTADRGRPDGGRAAFAGEQSATNGRADGDHRAVPRSR